MKRLWSPWRMKYIMNHSHTDQCIFCKALELKESNQNLIVNRGKYAFVLLNRYPYTSGHLMVAPYAHQPSLEELDEETRSELINLVTHAEKVLKKVYKPEGFNIGANIGSVAGAGVEGHVHFHIVPRWKGDTNFMSVVGETRVLPESLEDTLERIIIEW